MPSGTGKRPRVVSGEGKSTEIAKNVKNEICETKILTGKVASHESKGESG